MNWDLAPKLRCDLAAFGGINLSGERSLVEIYTVGGRQGDVSSDYLKSLVFLAPVGTRLLLMTSDDPERWAESPWRCVKVMAGSTFTTKEGRTGVRVPDLDWLDAFDARRTDPELQCSFEEATSLEHAGWTFGRTGSIPLKCNIKAIKIDRF